MTERPKRHISKRLSSDPSLFAPKTFPNNPLVAATVTDRKAWKGFCEIESEPAYFNIMLRDFGVEGVKVQEIVSLDEEILACLPRPIYGLVFLFKWREEDPDKLEQSCPEEVWFANQTVSNACASVAMLNIVNNIPSIELGEHLQQFKEFTKELSPALRGDAISNFTFVKEIHNSFARKMDMLNADLHLKNDVIARKQSKRPSAGNEDDDTGFHFIAYVPIDGNVWKLDGLKRQPQKLGTAKSADWVRTAKPDIEACMSEYEEGQIEFAILSLVRDPLRDLLSALATNVRGIQALAAHLEGITAEKENGDSTEHQGDPLNDDILTGPDLAIGLTQDVIKQAQAPPSIESALGSHVVSTIRLCQQELGVAQIRLRALIRDECESKHSDEEKANARRHDYGPLALKLAQILARKPIVGYEKFGSREKPAMERRADPTIQLDVDHSILDYLLYNAIRAFICDFRAGSRGDGAHNRNEHHAETTVQLVASFLILFRSMHPGEHGTKEIQIRLRLLKFASLFCSRFTSVPIEPSERKLKSLRDQCHKRRKACDIAGFFIGAVKYESANPAAQATDKTNPEGNMTASFHGSAYPTSLIDSLPSFMALSAAQSALQELPVSDVWMRLAAGFMAHAALEQSLVYQMELEDAVEEAFAWRFDPGSIAEEGTDEWAINAMFFGEEGEVVGWSDIRNEHIRAVIPPDGISLKIHAEELLANELPLDALVESLVSFIEGLLNAQPKPLYEQLESGKVDGLSRKEVQAMREAMGIN